MQNEPFVICDNLVKIYPIAEQKVIALQGLTLEIARGEMMTLIGPSGVGKSTLLNVLGGLDLPSAGRVSVGDWDLLRMSEPERVQFKREVVGFVWQQPARNLLNYLTARENVELPMQLNGVSSTAQKKRALDLLEMVGLSDRANARPERLSGGEQQRVALAVALANNPPLLLGDELTGQVDSESAMRLCDALRAIQNAFGTTIVMVTHDPLVAGRTDRVVTVRDGRTSTEIRRRRDPGDGATHEEQWVLLDPVGRLQLPHGYMDTLEMRQRVRLHLEPDHISIWPGTAGTPPTEPRRSSSVSPEQTSAAAHPSKDLVSPEATGVSVAVEKLTRTFELPGETIHALAQVSLNIHSGGMAVIKGPSGSGKTTLLNLLAGLDEPTSGEVCVGGRALARMSPQEKVEFRRKQVGFVFQTFGLLPFLSVAENVEVSLRLLGTRPRERQALVADALKQVGLADRARHRPYELSGGEQQRVAIARALVKHPVLILADEPTGQVDSLTGAGIIALLKKIAKETRVTVVVASHDVNVHEAADQLFELKDGRLVG